ncbi:transcriptional Coactivator p15-domain-containing protein [Papiliotrema laurentii]|uniref:Transcriptional Coactivator p15-domain-containing protein n=1 Tax=Papiliotrema laurentii TaxID=5418 RepID=A0AAD9CZ96_PAPLA|nr:transcriptional Coactivator p15-domain-containing protein [Papiliotrema laurentii]
MPPKKRPADDDEKQGQGPKSTGPISKKGKKETVSGQVQALGEVHENENGEKYLKLGEYRRATVRRYEGQVLVDIREFYKDKTSGQIRPGAKGISLKPEQWELLKNNSSKIDDLLAEIAE